MIQSYMSLILQSWRLVWKYKVLWFVGLFVTELSFFLTFNSRNDIFLYIASSNDALFYFYQFFSKFSAFLLMLLMILFVLAVSFFALVFKAGLVSVVKASLAGQKMSFKQTFYKGVKKFLPMLVLEIYFLIPNILLFLIFLINARTIDSLTVDIITGLLMLSYNVLIMLFNIFCYHYIVNEQQTPWEALKNGWRLFIVKFTDVIIINVIRMLVYLAMFIVNVIAVFLALIPFVLLAFLLYYIGLIWLSIIVAIFGGLALVFLIFLLKGFKTAYVYLLFSQSFEQLK